MSDFIIRNGRGSGERARVDEDGRLWVDALTAAQVSASTEDGTQYVFPVGRRSVTTTATEHSVLRINPNSNTKKFHLQRLFVSVLNSTPMLFRLYRGSSAPTANNVSFSPGNANTNSVNAGSFDADVWDGVGTGMTVATKGTEAFAGYFGPGAFDVPVEGGQIWGLNAAILVTVECTVANLFTAVVTGWEAAV